MNLPKECYAYCSALAPLTAVTDGIYRQFARYDDSRYLIITGVSRVEGYEFDEPDEMPATRVQFDCYADTQAAADDIADVVQTTFREFSGAMGAATVEMTQLQNRIDLSEQDGDRQRAHVLVDCLFHYKEPK